LASNQRPIIHVRHCSTEPNSPLRPERPGNAFKDEVQPLPGEKQFSKTVNSAFIGTGLEAYLHEQALPIWSLPA
jgi:nicotinamidase-related amidase